MKKLLLTAALFTAGAMAIAQPPSSNMAPPSAEQKLEHTKQMLQNEVLLSSTQITAMEKVFKTFFAAEEQVRKDNPPPPPPDAKVKNAMDKLVKERDESVKMILTADQFKKFEAVMQKMHPQPTGRGDKNMPPPPTE